MSVKPLDRPGFGIVNPFGQFWSTDIFDSEDDAKRHLERFWSGVKNAPSLDQFTVVPALLVIQERQP
jgi:hypothetical protein